MQAPVTGVSRMVRALALEVSVDFMTKVRSDDLLTSARRCLVLMVRVLV